MNNQTQAAQKVSLPREILSHFRWLNRLIREGDFVDKVLDVLDAVPEGIKQVTNSKLDYRDGIASHLSRSNNPISSSSNT